MLTLLTILTTFCSRWHVEATTPSVSPQTGTSSPGVRTTVARLEVGPRLTRGITISHTWSHSSQRSILLKAKIVANCHILPSQDTIFAAHQERCRQASADARLSVSPVVRPAPWRSSRTERFSILKIISFYRSSGLWLGLQWKWATGSRQQHQSAESTTSDRFTRGGRDQCGEKVCWKHLSESQRSTKVCGYAHTLAVTDEGALYAWGANSYGQVDNTVWQDQDFDKN